MTVIMNTPAGWGQPHTKTISLRARPAGQGKASSLKQSGVH